MSDEKNKTNGGISLLAVPPVIVTLWQGDVYIDNLSIADKKLHTCRYVVTYFVSNS